MSTHEESDFEEAHKIRERLRNFCERYAFQTRRGTEMGKDLVLDEMVRFVQLLMKPDA